MAEQAPMNVMLENSQHIINSLTKRVGVDMNARFVAEAEARDLRVFNSREASDVVRRQRLEIARLKGEPVDDMDEYLTSLNDEDLLIQNKRGCTEWH
jgi:hypothetical protein